MLVLVIVLVLVLYSDAFIPLTSSLCRYNKKISSLSFIPSSSIPSSSSSSSLSLSFSSSLEPSSISLSESTSLLIQKLLLKMKILWSNIKSKEYRQNVVDRLVLIYQSLLKNSNNNDINKSGEGWLISQLLLITIIVLGVHPLVRFFIRLSGWSFLLVGWYLMLGGIWNLGENITIYSAPTDKNVLITNGVYSKCRHPIYGGLILSCLGISIACNSVDKAIVSCVLALVMDKKADMEEEFLVSRYPFAYVTYMEKTRKLLPGLY
jgi:protein-S-isoprenylcysteine O-methyltransferase Ste14